MGFQTPGPFKTLDPYFFDCWATGQSLPNQYSNVKSLNNRLVESHPQQ